MLSKNSFLDEINKQYVITAKAKGATDRQVLYGHIFRNAMLIVIARLSRGHLSEIPTHELDPNRSNILFEMASASWALKAIMSRDYPIVFGTLFIFTLLGLFAQLVTDLTYTLVDPRIDFGTRGG
jgi:microcin C transport system permease protein